MVQKKRRDAHGDLVVIEQASHNAPDYWRAPVALAETIDATSSAGIDQELVSAARFLPTLCWIAYGDASIFWYNARWHDYCGTTPAEMEGWGWRSVHDPERLPLVMETWNECIRTGQPFEMTFPLRGADGNFRPFLTRAVPLRDASGKVVRWIGVNTEIGAQIRAELALEASEAKYEVLTDAMPQMVWSTLPDGFHDYYNAQWYAFTGVPVGSTDGEGWNGMFHPDDQDRAWTRWRHSLETGEDYDIEYRLRHHSGDYRWVLGRALPVRDEAGKITRWIGTCTDIDDAKRTSEQNELLSRELSHRIGNIFAVVSGLISLTASRDRASRPALNDLLGRVSALSRAHRHARPSSNARQVAIIEGGMQDLLRSLFVPYAAGDIPRISITGDDVTLDDRGSTPVAMVFHELATNSAKYGALSVAEGTVTVAIARRGSKIGIDWAESGGPAIAGPPQREGFGTELADLSIRRQLGGSITRDWAREGLRVAIELDETRLHRD